MEEQLQSTTARARGILCGLSHAGLPRDPRCGLHSRIRTIASRQEHENAAGILTDLRISRTAARPHHGVQATPGVRSQGSRIRCCTCLHRRAVHRALCRSGARYHACRASGAYGVEPRLAALPSVPSSKRAAWMHVPLALLCFLDGVVA